MHLWSASGELYPHNYAVTVTVLCVGMPEATCMYLSCSPLSTVVDTVIINAVLCTAVLCECK